jgi:hypothetical protein
MSLSGGTNRFVQAIRSGGLDTVEELKTAFRELAKSTHPDLSGPDSAELFLSIRSEYEAALAGFERHRFGASRLSRDSSGQASPAVAARELWACLALLLKRGFPKEPRHEKEILRYEYARWRLRGALRSLGREDPGAEGAPALFDSFEAELLGIRKAFPDSAGAALAFLRALVAHAEREHPAMRVALARELEDLGMNPGLGPPSLDFLALLASRLGIGRRLG